jgi:hypothetical protein
LLPQKIKILRGREQLLRLLAENIKDPKAPQGSRKVFTEILIKNLHAPASVCIWEQLMGTN